VANLTRASGPRVGVSASDVGASSSPPMSSGTASALRTAVVVLVVAVILLATLAGTLYVERAPSPQTTTSPKFVRLLDPTQVSAVLGGNWTRVDPAQTFFNASGSTGVFETESMEESGSPIVLLNLYVYGFNSTVYSGFVFKNDQIYYNHLMNVSQESGILAPSIKYWLYMSCSNGGTCDAAAAAALSTVYVVTLTVSTPVTQGFKTSPVNATVMEDLLKQELEQIPGALTMTT